MKIITINRVSKDTKSEIEELLLENGGTFSPAAFFTIELEGDSIATAIANSFV
jgi:hypothetical protein